MIQMVFSKIFISCRLSSKNQNDWSTWRFRCWGHKIIVKIKDIQKNEKKKFFIAIKDFGYEKREKYLLYMSKNTFKQHIDLLIVERKDKKILCSNQIFQYFHVCITSRKKQIFVVIIYKLLAQKKYQNIILMIILELILNK